MRLLEYQAKQVFSEYGIPVPEGFLINAGQDAGPTRFPAVIKAQVAIGGRGKAGGIRVVDSNLEAKAAIQDLFHLNIKGHPVRAIWVEHKANVLQEFYLAVLYDKKTNGPLVMASSAGGIDIEQIAKDNPEKIIRYDIDTRIGMQKYNLRFVAARLGLQDPEPFAVLVERMYSILIEKDATLVEINPLASTPNGWLALDGKVELDDKAEFRHQEWISRLREEQSILDDGCKTEAESLARERGITYVLLDGDIAMIADGAGTGMLTLDMIHDEGGQAANFCEMGGLANAKVMLEAMQVVLANPKAKVLLITLIGGLTRMDEIADGIAQYIRSHGKTIPIIVRMCGTREEIGKATLQEIGIEPYEDMALAVKAAVDLLRKGVPHGNPDQ